MAFRSETKKIFKQIKAVFNLESLQNPSNPRISANIICHNNISSIEACIKSLRNVVDEIVVVDGGSSDGTIEILEKYDAKIMVNKDWQGYSYQRNLAIQHSKGDWILKIDSDEFLSTSLRKNLRNLCRSKIYSGYKTFSRWVQNLSPNLINELNLISDDEIKNFLEASLNYQNVTNPLGQTNQTNLITTLSSKLTKDDLPKYVGKSTHRGRYKSVLRLVKKTPNLEFRGDIHEAFFGLDGLRMKKLSLETNNIYHLDPAINSFESRLEKVQEREKILAGSGHGEEYLPELYENLRTEEIPFEDLLLLKYVKPALIKH